MLCGEKKKKTPESYVDWSSDSLVSRHKTAADLRVLLNSTRSSD